MEWRTSDMEDRIDLLSSYCSHTKKTFLSARWAFGITNVGQSFLGGAHKFQTVLRKYAVECGFQYKFNSVHSCGAAVRTYRNPRIGSDLVSDVIACRLLTHPTDVVFDMKDGYGLDVSYWAAWLGVEKARNEIFGDHAMSFDQLRWCSYAVMQNNPHSYINLDFNQQTRWFVRFKRTLFTATAKDENQGMVDIFIMLVDAIRGKIMEQMSKRKVQSTGWVGEICPKMEKILVHAFENSRSWIASQSNDNIFELLLFKIVETTFTITWNRFTKWWSIGQRMRGLSTQFPRWKNPSSLSQDYFIAPPIYKRPSGRPKGKRIPSKSEVVQRIRCSRCGKMGHHNRKTCKEPM
ncbi:hypothetical protein ACSBR1_016239 [Camellia fascicularis]